MGKLFFPKMAAGNLVRNRRFEFPYLLTGLITVAMFYNMTFLTFHEELKNMPGGATIPTIMNLGTMVVGLFAVIFLLYTNTFLMKRRHKEIGLYNILGMSKRHIAVVMLWETVYTCLITVVGGLLLGILLSKLMLLLLYKILFFSVSFGFMVSWKSVGITAVLFVAIYLVALLLNLLHVHLSKPVELLKGAAWARRSPRPRSYWPSWGWSPWRRVLHCHHHRVSLGSPDALFPGGDPGDHRYLLPLHRRLHCLPEGHEEAEELLLPGQALHRNFRHALRMKQNAVGLANICILSTMVLVMISTCVCLYIGTGDALNAMYPHDIIYSQSWQDSGNRSKEEVRVQIQEAPGQGGHGAHPRPGGGPAYHRQQYAGGGYPRRSRSECRRDGSEQYRHHPGGHRGRLSPNDGEYPEPSAGRGCHLHHGEPRGVGEDFFPWTELLH